MPVTCVAHPPAPRPSEDLIRRYGALSTSLVSDVFDRWAGAPGILPVAAFRPGQVVVGPAFTVRTRPGDNLVVHKALDIADPGDMVVVAAGGATDRAIIGALMGHYAKTRGIVGLVIDGAVRDVSELTATSPPTFATGISHLGPYKDGPGELRGRIAIRGLVVDNGDIVIADEDGIAVVPRDRAEEILELAEAKGEAERRQDEAIARGDVDRSWVDKLVTLVDPPGDQP